MAARILQMLHVARKEDVAVVKLVDMVGFIDVVAGRKEVGEYLLSFRNLW